MENKFVVNIFHRPELSPEYAEKALGTGTGVRDESWISSGSSRTAPTNTG